MQGRRVFRYVRTPSQPDVTFTFGVLKSYPNVRGGKGSRSNLLRQAKIAELDTVVT
jgi:hypothetical protein